MKKVCFFADFCSLWCSAVFVVIYVHLLMEIGGFVGTLEDEIEVDEEEDPRSSRRGRDDMDEHDDDDDDEDDGLFFLYISSWC